MEIHKELSLHVVYLFLREKRSKFNGVCASRLNINIRMCVCVCVCVCVRACIYMYVVIWSTAGPNFTYEGWNFNSGNYLFTANTK